jgi:hypothetical protein
MHGKTTIKRNTYLKAFIGSSNLNNLYLKCHCGRFNILKFNFVTNLQSAVHLTEALQVLAE